jgi:hypothetical protein
MRRANVEYTKSIKSTRDRRMIIEIPNYVKDDDGSIWGYCSDFMGFKKIKYYHMHVESVFKF